MPAYDHIVVGGGVSGMTCALLLAMQGARVALVESFRQLGPTIRGFRRHGVQFETGLHYLGGYAPGQALATYLDHLGLGPLLHRVPYNPEGFDRIIFEKTGRCVDLPCGFAQARAQLTAVFPGEEKAIQQYFTTLETVVSASVFLNTEHEWNLDAMIPDVPIAAQTLGQYVAGLTDNSELQNVLTSHSLLYGCSPQEAELYIHAVISGSYFLSASAIEGGGRVLVQAYEQRLRALDVECFCGQPVQEIAISPNRTVRGVRLADSTFLAGSSCIWTAHPALLVESVPDFAFRPAFVKRMRALEDTPSALMLFGISEQTVPALEGRNIFSWPCTPDEAMYQGTAALENSALYLSATRDKGSGKTAVTAIAPSHISFFEKWQHSTPKNRPEAYIRYKADRMDAFEKEIFQRFPALETQVTFVDAATPLTFQAYCATPAGSLYGVRHTANQFSPAPVTKVSGLRLAGQSILAPGILGAIISAYLTCGMLVDYSTLQAQLRESDA